MTKVFYILSGVEITGPSRTNQGAFDTLGICTGKRSFLLSYSILHVFFGKTKGQQSIFTFYSPGNFVPEGEQLFMLPFMDPRAPAFVLLLGKRNMLFLYFIGYIIYLIG